MPRDAFSNYTLPAGNPVVTGTIIASSWANTTLNDIATALTQSLSTDGSTASVSLAGKTRTGGILAGTTINTSTANALNLAGVTNLSGGAIQFPAAQIPSANANTLDDYEEGTWTPVLNATTPGNLNVVYGARNANYTKIGRQVFIELYLNLTTFTHTTAAGNFLISGLPFTSANIDNYGACKFDFWNINFVGAGPPAITVYGSPVAWVQAADTRIFFNLSGLSNVASAPVGVGNHTSGTAAIVGVSITYNTST